MDSVHPDFDILPAERNAIAMHRPIFDIEPRKIRLRPDLRKRFFRFRFHRIFRLCNLEFEKEAFLSLFPWHGNEVITSKAGLAIRAYDIIFDEKGCHAKDEAMIERFLVLCRVVIARELYEIAAKPFFGARRITVQERPQETHERGLAEAMLVALYDFDSVSPANVSVLSVVR